VNPKTRIIAARIRSALLAFTAIYAFLLPAAILVHDLRDPALQTNQIPQFAYRWHAALSERISPWATERVQSLKAMGLTVDNISGTEWPMFSAVFYLWSTEALQKHWETSGDAAEEAPAVYAREAIGASVRLIVDPNNASWVREHWGDDYMQRENLFYRMLLISGLTSYQRLTGDSQYQELLTTQVTSLSAELNNSPYGLLDDYPGQCYPVDIVSAIAAIKRAGELLGNDTEDFVTRSLRGFQDSRLDAQTGLPAYIADPRTGQGYGPARGVGMSYMLIWAPELWPAAAEEWYGKYEQDFWSERTLISGFTEFAKESGMPPFMVEVDAGPVVNHYGVAASAFGIGAAKVNNRVQHAYALAAEALVASWPLPDGTLLLPRLVSNLADAPYVGGAALLFAFTREPMNSQADEVEVSLPVFVYLALVFYGGVGIILLRAAYFQLRLKE
jgi:hypothetical protein